MAEETDSVLEPRRNAEFAGHEQAAAAIMRAWTSGRMHHAWLISGPRGVGKATLAYRVARLALSGAGGADLFGGVVPTLDTGADSPVFRQVASGGHPDLLTIERGFDEKRDRQRTEIVVDDIRQVGEFLHLKAALGGWRVVIIDSADDMNRNAANALLKILEEPPRQALLLVVSHAPNRLLATIRSRCRRLTLGPLPDATVHDLLARQMPDLSEADRRLLVRLGNGSIGRAMEIAMADGIELYRDIAEQLDKMPKIDGMALHGLADRIAKGGGEGPFRLASELLLEKVARSLRASASRHDASAGDADGLSRHVRPSNLEQWLDLWEKISRLFAKTESTNLDRKQVWIGALLEIGGLAGR